MTARRIKNAAQMLWRAGVPGALRPGAVVKLLRQWRGFPSSPSALVGFHALSAPGKAALVDGTAPLSYRELEDGIRRLAGGLEGLGVGSGDRVALMMGNNLHHVLAQLALPRIGGVAVEIGTRLKAAEVAHILRTSQPAVLLADEECLQVSARAGRDEAGLPAEERVLPCPSGIEALMARATPAPGGADVAEMMVYTSGTTGRPKGARRRYAGLRHPAAVDLLRQLPIRCDERHLVLCPLYHASAQAFASAVLSFGGTLHLRDGADPEGALALISRERITSGFMVPTLLARLAELPPAIRARHDMSCLRWLISGAAPLSTRTARRIRESFGPVLFNFYGTTETGFVTLALPREHEERPGTIGRALCGVEIELRDDAGRPVTMGEPGEIHVRSSLLFEGYHGEPGGRGVDGFVGTGDVGHVDRDGYYYIDDRKADFVISGGINIYPMEIERRLLEHEAVLEAAVVGVPDPEWGETLRAFVIARREVSADELRAHCRDALADYKCPRAFTFVTDLPRGPLGKVLKRALRG